MFKGFYNLTSGVLTNQRHLNVVANNMVNVSTAGFKQETYTATTFDDVIYSRVGNENGQGEEIGRQSYARVTSEVYTDYSEGTLEPTGMPLDFAIVGDGFFAIESNEGVFYTRQGNFSLDDNGYLVLGNHGYVLNPQGEHIYLGIDKITVDSAGNIFYDNAEGTDGFLGQVGVYAFEDNDQLERNDNGYFTGEGAQAVLTSQVMNEYQERSNVDIVDQMTEMMTYQRSLQSATQLMKMYDSLMTKATGEVGRL